jgi:hypothetical protein
LWFGTIVFFTVAALLIFQTFEGLGAPGASRPPWLPLPGNFTKENGTQLAGVALGPLFEWYFPLQAGCALLTLGTALSWFSGGMASTVEKLRIAVLVVALLTVAAGWPVARQVGQLRVQRYASDAAVAESARAHFGTLHLYSLFLNFGTMILVGVALGLAANLPTAVARPVAENKAER